ncbi:MAG: hypothetical protein JEY96_15365 [Bacteroidales bacterium]|nr:hypothetical protein [Bacteroidales bacterium]
MKKTLSLVALILLSVTILLSQENNNGREKSLKSKNIVSEKEIEKPISKSEVQEPSTKQLVGENMYIKGKLGLGTDIEDLQDLAGYTMVLKENDIRILFDDNSTDAGFASNDWLMEINSKEIDGTNHFAIQDVTNDKYPFKIISGAPNNSLFINNLGNLGIGSGDPKLKLQLTKGDTPGLRLEQDGTSGWGTYTWDIAANETNFFVRDFTNGSTLPFRIMAGAPSLSMKIDKKGYTSLGKSNASERLDIAGNIHLDSILRITPLLENNIEAQEGDLYMDGNDHILKLYTGEKWVTLSQERTIFLSDDYLIRGSDTLADFSNYIHNTDEQILSLIGTNLTISNGNELDVSALMDNKDEQTLSLTGNALEISNGNQIDLSSLLINQQEQIDELKKAVMELQELVSTLTDNGSDLSAIPNQSLVKQNNPNPFTFTTEIPYYIDPEVKDAFIVIYTDQGSVIEKVSISERRSGTYKFVSEKSSSKIYFYSLIVDGVKMNTKKMIAL